MNEFGVKHILDKWKEIFITMHMVRKNLNYEVISFFLILYPFLVFPWNIYFLSITKLIYLTFGSILIWMVFSLEWIKDRRLLLVPKTTGERLALLFLFLICLSTWFAQNRVISLFGSYDKYQGLIAWFGYITLFLFTYHLIPITKQVKIIKLMVLVSFFCGIYGIIQHFYLEELIGKKDGIPTFVRSWAFFDHANHFGSYLVIMMILGMTLYLLAKTRIQTIIQWLIICTLFVSLLYTTTRGAWVALIIGWLLLTILVVWKRKGLWKRWFLLIASFFIISQIVNFSEDNFFFSRLISLGNDVNTVITDQDRSDEAGSGRWSIWHRTFPIIKEHYLLGTGPNSFSLVFPLTKREKEYGLDNAHNDYIEIAMTMGIPALLVYLAFIFTVLKCSFFSVKMLDGDEEIYLYGLIVAILSYLIKVFFNISVVGVAPFFWVLLAMCYSYSLKIKTSSKSVF